MAEEAPEEVGEEMVEMTPQEDVYSFMMLIGPTESVDSEGKFNIDTMVGFFLVIVTLIVQGYLLWAVYNSVVGGNTEWEMGIVDTGANKPLYDPDPKPPPKCAQGNALCSNEAGDKISCAPHSLRLLGGWDELDTNHDGVWTMEEVEAQREELMCKYVVDPKEIFNVFISFIMEHKDEIWIHPDVLNRRKIFKSYFSYTMGDMIMCGYRNEMHCPNLVKRGFFDAPLEFRTVPRVGNTIDSAIQYCRRLLEEGGTCELLMPGSYSTWRVSSTQECLDKKYSKFIYEHPTSGQRRSMLEVSYAAVKQYEKTATWLFKVYKTMIVFLWISSMIVEFKKMVNIVTWIIRMDSTKKAAEDGKDAVERDEGGAYTINGITMQHRVIQAVVTVIRLFMLTVLTFVGNSLLLASPDFMSLLFDAVSLKFVIDLQEMFYTQILRQTVRDQTGAVNPMEVKQLGLSFLNRNPGIKDCMWFFFAIGMACFVMYQYYKVSVTPLRDAITCACLGEGERCVEGSLFDYAFWHNYFKTTIPQAKNEIQMMEESSFMQIANSTFESGKSILSRNRYGYVVPAM